MKFFILSLIAALLPFSYNVIKASEASIFLAFAILLLWRTIFTLDALPSGMIALIFILITASSNYSFYWLNSLLLAILLLLWIIIRKPIIFNSRLDIILIISGIVFSIIIKASHPVFYSLLYVYVSNNLERGEKIRKISTVLIFSLLISCLMSWLAMDKADRYLHNAKLLSHTGQQSEAISYFKKASELQPKNAALHFLLANRYYILNEYSAAINEFEKSVILNPLKPQEMAEAYYKLGRLYSITQKWDKAFANYQKVILLMKSKNIVLNNGMAEDNFFSALCLENSGLLEKAIIEYRKHLEYSPGNTAARYNLAKILSTKDFKTQAVNEYKILISQDENNVNYHIGIADIYKLDPTADGTRHQTIVNEYEKILELQPFNIGASSSLVNAYRRAGLKQKAKNLSKEIMKRHPFSSQGYLFYGNLLLSDKDFKNASKFYKKALFLAPNDLTIIIRLIDSYSLNNQFKEAALLLSRSLNKFPDNKELISRLNFLNSKL